MFDGSDSPWCSRAEAASYLAFEDTETIDAKLTDSKHFQPGKMRYRVMRDGSRLKKVRIWKADVLAMLPPFDAEEAA